LIQNDKASEGGAQFRGFCGIFPNREKGENAVFKGILWPFSGALVGTTVSQSAMLNGMKAAPLAQIGVLSATCTKAAGPQSVSISFMSIDPER
jgi:hypothetical protein